MIYSPQVEFKHIQHSVFTIKQQLFHFLIVFRFICCDYEYFEISLFSIINDEFFYAKQKKNQRSFCKVKLFPDIHFSLLFSLLHSANRCIINSREK